MQRDIENATENGTQAEVIVAVVIAMAVIVVLVVVVDIVVAVMVVMVVVVPVLKMVLRYENGVYRLQKHHSLEQSHRTDLRRFRLLAIREELRSLSRGGWHVAGLAGKMRVR